MKILEKIKDNKIFFVVFGLITISSAIYIFEKGFSNIVDNCYYPLYVVNYDCGLSSRLLVGSVFSLFFKNTLSITVINTVLLILYFALCFCICLFINNYIKNSQYSKGIGIYITFAVMSPIFLALLQYLGTTDIFWLFIVLACIFVANKKFLRWLLPLLCIAGLAVHEVFLVTYLPMIALIIIYNFSKKSEAADIVFITACILSIGAAAVYFSFIGDETMKMTSDEFIKFATDRLDLKGTALDDYYARSIFFWDTPDVEEYIGFFGYLKYNLEKFVLGIGGSIYKIISHLISAFLTAVPFLILMFKCAKNEKNIEKKFVFICTLLLGVPTAVLLFFSTDTERYSLHFLLNIIFLMSYFTKEDDHQFTESCAWMQMKIKGNPITVIALILMTITAVF